MSKKNDFTDLVICLEEISYQLERIVVCQEKQLSGQIIAEFDSAAELAKNYKEAEDVKNIDPAERKS